MKNETIDMFGHDNALDILKKQTMEKAHGHGTKCPVCNQFLKVYRRKISSAMAMGLIRAMQVYGKGVQFHINDIANQLNMNVVPDFTKLRYWGMLRQADHITGTDGKKQSGVWELTEKGIDFAKGDIATARYVFLYDGILQGKSDEVTTIRDCIGDKFDYNELMQPVRYKELTA